MTVSAPTEPMLQPPRRRWAVIALVVAVLVVVGFLAISNIGSALVYYRTPTEVIAMEDPVGQVMRVGGVVKAGTVQGPPTDLYFTLTDGETEMRVHSTVAPTRSFREGSGAVVEGALSTHGLFEATRVIVKHDENYEAPPPGAVPSERVFDPGE